jgi:hypothetical protein
VGMCVCVCMWVAHMLWMDNSFVLVASAFLMAHHLFG